MDAKQNIWSFWGQTPEVPAALETAVEESATIWISWVVSPKRTLNELHSEFNE
jgi:hypothetical protein